MKINKIPSQNILHDALDYNPETGIFFWKDRLDRAAWWNGKFSGKIAGTKNTKGIIIFINSRPYCAHRIAWVYIHGDTLSVDIQIDHKNNNPHEAYMKAAKRLHGEFARVA